MNSKKISMSKPSIKLMADYHCWPLWHYGGKEVGNIDPRELGVTEVLAAKLAGWAAAFDAHLNVSAPASSAWTEDEKKAFDIEGRQLSRALAKEVGERFSVFYFEPLSARCIPVEAL